MKMESMNIGRGRDSAHYLQKRGGVGKDLLLSFLISTVILLLVGLLWQIKWEGGDDFIINQAMIGSNGESTPYVLVMQYPLSWLLYKLYFLFPTINLLGLAELFSVWLSFLIFDYLLMQANEKWGAWLAVGFSLAFAPSFYMNLQYTRTATLLVLSGASMLLYCIDTNRGLLWKISSVLLIWLGMMFRWGGGYIAVPYLGLLVLFRHSDLLKQHVKRKSFAGWIAVVLCGLLCINVTDNLAYEQFDQESNWRQFNSSRASAVDYMPAAYEDENLGISYNDYHMIKYSMIIDDYFSEDLFDSISENIEVKESTFQSELDRFLDEIPEGIVKYVRNGKMAGRNNIFPMLLFAVLLACLFISKKNILMVIFTIGGTMLICFYFIWTGRFPPWVQDPLYLTAGFSLFYCIDVKKASIQKIRNVKWCRAAFCLLLSCCTAGMLISCIQYCNVRNSRNFCDSEMSQIISMIEEDKENIYLIDSFSNSPYPIMDGYSICQVQESGTWSNLIRGTWFLGHPIFDGQLDRLGISSLIKDMPEKNIHILSGVESPTLDMYATFLNEHYDIQVTPEEVWSGEKYAIYVLAP